jgi:hypothetical protein
MKALLIDVGALAVFLSCMAIAYWRGVSPEAKPVTRRANPLAGERAGG